MKTWARKSLNILSGVALGGVVASGAFLVVTHFLLASNPGCPPGLVEEQCSFRPLADAFIAVCCAFVVWLVASFVLARHLLRRSARKSTRAGNTYLLARRDLNHRLIVGSTLYI